MEKKAPIFGWIAFGLGITTWILWDFSMILSPSAVIIGIISLVKEKRNWQGIVGLCLGSASVFAMIIGVILIASGVISIFDFM
ncbi:MAG: hypothetical protein FWF57_09215 [Defluviitaleaceae bacterium]|nr:hypothetical protein [Defluviitaleaceae bacterium]